MGEVQITPFETEDALIAMNSTPEQIPCLVEDLLLEVGTSMLTASIRHQRPTMPA